MLKARQLIEARTEAEAILMATEKALKQGSHLVTEKDLSSIKAAMAAVEAAKSGTDHKAIRAKHGRSRNSHASSRRSLDGHIVERSLGEQEALRADIGEIGSEWRMAR